jgi:hypothetical protein
MLKKLRGLDGERRREILGGVELLPVARGCEIPKDVAKFN